MLQVLTQNILPVFSLLALGFILGRAEKVTQSEATALNRMSFVILQPALIFPLINQIEWSEFRADAIALYAGCQVILFTATFLVLRHVMRRAVLEAWLLGMAVIFVNTLLYIWPISFLIYGTAAAVPITGIVAWDTAFTFAFFIITTQILSGQSSSWVSTLKSVVSNPVLIAILLGILTNVMRLEVPQPLLIAMDFAGAGAAPLTLFALGVILSSHPLRMTKTIALVSALKLFAFPAMVFVALQLGQRPPNWNAMLILTSAGPSGAMAFALAVLHGVRTDQIAPVIIWTSAFSLLSLALLA